MRKWGGLAAIAAVGVVLRAESAKAQLFQQIQTAGVEVLGAIPFWLAIGCYGGGGFALVYGAWNIWKHFTHRHHGGPTLALSCASFVSGFILLGLISWATLGTAWLTGGGPTAGSSGGVVF